MLFRNPMTAPAELKTVVLYQIDKNDKAFGEKFIRNLMEDFIPVAQMIPVLTEKAEASMGDTFILNACYERFNGGDVDGLQYSMSVGDAIKIDDIIYRCKIFGWTKE